LVVIDDPDDDVDEELRQVLQMSLMESVGNTSEAERLRQSLQKIPQVGAQDSALNDIENQNDSRNPSNPQGAPNSALVKVDENSIKTAPLPLRGNPRKSNFSDLFSREKMKNRDGVVDNENLAGLNRGSDYGISIDDVGFESELFPSLNRNSLEPDKVKRLRESAKAPGDEAYPTLKGFKQMPSSDNVPQQKKIEDMTEEEQFQMALELSRLEQSGTIDVSYSEMPFALNDAGLERKNDDRFNGEREDDIPSFSSTSSNKEDGMASDRDRETEQDLRPFPEMPRRRDRESTQYEAGERSPEIGVARPQPATDYFDDEIPQLTDNPAVNDGALEPSFVENASSSSNVAQKSLSTPLHESASASFRDAASTDSVQSTAANSDREAALNSARGPTSNIAPDSSAQTKPTPDPSSLLISSESDRFPSEAIDATLLRQNEDRGFLPSSFRLVSVISHIGSDPGNGHYVTDAFDFRADVWRRYDDERVVQTDLYTIRSNEAKRAYLFAYMDKGVFKKLSMMNKKSD